jgi:hypothetical protein
MMLNLKKLVELRDNLLLWLMSVELLLSAE